LRENNRELLEGHVEKEDKAQPGNPTTTTTTTPEPRTAMWSPRQRLKVEAAGTKRTATKQEARAGSDSRSDWKKTRTTKGKGTLSW
jgi:hypothetical protein